MEKGQIVKYLAFTDSFGKYHTEIPKMLITKVYEVKNQHIDNYIRVCADNINIDRINNIVSVDAHERHFELI